MSAIIDVLKRSLGENYTFELLGPDGGAWKGTLIIRKILREDTDGSLDDWSEISEETLAPSVAKVLECLQALPHPVQPNNLEVFHRRVRVHGRSSVTVMMRICVSIVA
jgi:hypothetical protein